MPRRPVQLSALLRDLGAQLPILLGGNLVGIYLYGSLTQAAFDPKRSDIDCIVVTKRALSEAQFKRLRAWLTLAAKSNPWTSRLQASFLLRDKVLTMNAPSCLYQFGRLKRSRSDANPIIWMNVLNSGEILYGPRPVSFVPPITRKILFRALEREAGYLREEIINNPHSKWRAVPFYRAYAVLTLCRILYSFSTGTVVSKQRAAKWAMKRLPPQWSELILQALASDAGNRRARIPVRRIAQFINFTDAQLHTRPLPRQRA
jgi:Domain of unknown function (DUF4111)